MRVIVANLVNVDAAFAVNANHAQMLCRNLSYMTAIGGEVNGTTGCDLRLDPF